MIFEYVPMIGSGEYAHYGDAKGSFIYLGLGFVFWTIACWGYFRLFVRPILVRKSINNIKTNGVRSLAKIISRDLVKHVKGIDFLELTIQLKNLSGTTIQIPCNIEDGRPELDRFKVGSTLPMRIDPDLKSPFFLPEEGETRQNSRLFAIRISCFLGLILFCFGYLLFSYWFQSRGHGWRFLHFWHPWVTIPLWGLIYGGIFNIIIVYVLPISGNAFGLEMTRDMPVIFRGKKALATIQSANQTGTYINEQPEILFVLTFKDDHGIDHRGQIKTVVSLLELNSVHRPTRQIFYLPEDPQKIIFADEYLPEQPIIIQENLN